ncbi:hypothetical protein [Streptomyces sp. 184]|uniref:hypothetical protein n=1 Tax=Streptomyces sp. 184 TaxID=1827526 RepID=UPI00389278D2
MKFNRVAAATAGAALLVGTLAVGAVPAGATQQDGRTAMSCYGDAKSFTKYQGDVSYPVPATGNYLTTTSSCSDINVRTGWDVFVRVCFVRTGCQADWKRTEGGEWLVVATNVRDGAQYYLNFITKDLITGGYAA